MGEHELEGLGDILAEGEEEDELFKLKEEMPQPQLDL